MSAILDQIILRKRKDLEEMKRRFPLHRLKRALKGGRKTPIRSFKKAVSNSHKINIIAEIKKASPSGGVLRENFQPMRIANLYELGGASALSILTEPHFFKGRPSYLRTVRQVTNLPLLRKDFIFETYQLYETALLEADAFLLITSILTLEELKDLIQLGDELGMDALVETHSDEDLKKALEAGAKIIGINNRNLRTLDVDVNRSKKLLPHIPKDKTVVVESGLQTHEEILDYKSLGIHSFLIGSTFMKSDDILGKLRDVLGDDKKWLKDVSM